MHTHARLVRATGSFARATSQKYLPNNNTLRYQDGYPIHWFMQESVYELSEIAGQEISWRRFRPNVVIQGGAAQTEHLIFKGEIGSVPFVDPKPCDRCPVTTFDQDTSEYVGPEPLKSLATYKKWRNKNGDLKVIFGENMLPLATAWIKVGDQLNLVSKRDPPLVYGASV